MVLWGHFEGEGSFVSLWVFLWVSYGVIEGPEGEAGGGFPTLGEGLPHSPPPRPHHAVPVGSLGLWGGTHGVELGALGLGLGV